MQRVGQPPWWAILGTAVFVVLVPGTVVGWIPYMLSDQWGFAAPLGGLEVGRYLGGALIIVGALVFVDFVSRFVWEGHGTPAPIAPTKNLVVHGLFRWVRNPGYVAIIAMLIGQALLLGNVGILAYGAAMAAGFHVFVVHYEEPTLRKTFGAEFDAYCRRVPRWLPRLTARDDLEDR